MSRARELAKVGGKNQQVIAGLSSHVGVSTFAADVFMYSNLEVTGTTTFNGGTLTLGDAASDNVVFGADVNSHIIPNSDDTYDLGSASQQWRNLHLDGVANIDTLNVEGTATFSTALANSNLQNSSISLGGVSIALGETNATPAFDLSDATDYPTSSLSGTITNAQLAGSIANSKLANSTVSFGGVELALGAGDATPAFDLQDATNYPTSSLSGTITNGQLAGSIANSKLANNSVSYGGIELALGASDATPAFDLSDATGLPISSGVSGLASNVATFLGTPSSANLRSVVTDETGTGALVFGTSPTIATPDVTGRATMDDIALSGGITVGAGLTVTGDLVVNGTTTTINSTTISVDDKHIELGATSSPDDSSADGGGVILKGGSDHSILWYNDNDHWESSEHFNLVSGKSYQIADTAVLSATALGSGVVSSSLTSVGTIASGVWQGTAIANAYIANSTVSYGGIELALGASDATPAFDLTDATSLPISTGVSGLGSNVATFLATPSSSNLASCVTDETGGGGALVFSSNPLFSGLTVSDDIVPNANGTIDIGSTGTRFANVYTSDLDLSNEAKGVNSVDGTWGSYLIEEGENDLYITNRRSGKRYRFMMEEV
tara:strand:+ start:35359 stop:37194 length:1836 start_codon:yes stop_codon:yes gene_type:complete